MTTTTDATPTQDGRRPAGAQPPDPLPLAAAHALNTELYQLTRILQTLKNSINRDGVPHSTYLLLFRLISDGPRRAGALAEAVGTDPSTVSRQIDWLVRSGLVERQADPSDGRASLLVATEAGVATQQQMRAGRDQMMADVLGAWQPADVEHLTRLLARFTTDLTDHLPQIVAGPLRRGAAPGATDTPAPSTAKDPS